jgi:hypothetical protein
MKSDAQIGSPHQDVSFKPLKITFQQKIVCQHFF